MKNDEQMRLKATLRIKFILMVIKILASFYCSSAKELMD